jgi:outer membrane protein assembly factor BamD (BamD/ComL family)
MNVKSISFIVLCFLMVYASVAQAARVRVPQFENDEAATAYFVEHFNKGCEAYNEGHFHRAAIQFRRVVKSFPGQECAVPAYFYLGVSYFHNHEFEFANLEFSNYLKGAGEPEFFEEALQYKFRIAEAFRYGMKRRLFRLHAFPKCLTGRSLAVKIYDEIIAAAPNHELAASSLYAKGCLLQEMGDYRCSIDAFQTFIRRFPKHERTPDCYLKIAEVYYDQSICEFQNPDILALSEINARKFEEDFPRDKRTCCARDYIKKIEELYAKGLCDIGLFYERIEQPEAAVLYYRNAISDFPHTRIADVCRYRVQALGYDFAEFSASNPLLEGQERLETKEQTNREEGTIIPAPNPCLGGSCSLDA